MKATHTPVLTEIYEQKKEYDAHKKKLSLIRFQRKSQLAPDNSKHIHLEILRKNLKAFEQRTTDQKEKIDRYNQKMKCKLEKIRGSITQKPSIISCNSSRSLHSNSNRSRVEQQRENYRIVQKMRSMSSDLSTKHLMRDYNQSVVIKNRLRRYQSNKDGAVVLKAEKLLGNAYLLACRQRQRFPAASQSNNLQLFTKNDKVNQAQFYRKEEIIKNRIKNNAQLFKTAHQRKIRSLTEMSNKLKKTDERVAQVFPTELTREK